MNKAWVTLIALLSAGCGKGTDQSSSTSPSHTASAATANAPQMTGITPQPPATAIPGYVPSSVPGMIRIADKAYFLTTAKWPGKYIPVCWEAGVSSGSERQWVQDAVEKSWQANSSLKFGFAPVACAQNAKGIRIDVRDDGPQDGPHTIGLGNQIDGKSKGMVLNFTFRTWSEPCAKDEQTREMCIRSIAVHEFGHALAFAHEQNRPDTPGECKQPAQGANGNLTLTPWDPHSVMNYCNTVYNNNGVLSPDDIIMLKAQYGG